MVQAPMEVQMKMFPNKKHQDREQSTMDMSISGVEKEKTFDCRWDVYGMNDNEIFGEIARN